MIIIIYDHYLIRPTHSNLPPPPSLPTPFPPLPPLEKIYLLYYFFSSHYSIQSKQMISLQSGIS